MKLLLVEDSRTVRTYVEAALAGADDIMLLPPVDDGETAVVVAKSELPDLILMDLCLPGLDGIGAIAEIMASAPCPIVVLSSHLDEPDRNRVFESLNAGAVDVLAKPQSLAPAVFKAFQQQLLKTVRLMKEARVVRRRVPASAPASGRSYQPGPHGHELVLIGASTGGPPLVFKMLSSLGPSFAIPIVIAQHTLHGFESAMASWLSHSGRSVRVAQPGASLRPGTVYLLPPNMLCRVRRLDLDIQPNHGYAIDAVGPSIDVVFQSAAEWFGARCAAFLLSGMGSDGARGLLRLRAAGALTVTQTGDTCVVDGMPAAARALGAATYDLPPAEMLRLLSRLTSPQAPPDR